MKNGQAHDRRTPDYNDWFTPTTGNYKGLNVDIVLYYPILDCAYAYELSSIGIRVDADTLINHLKIKGEKRRKELYFHKRLLNGEIPLCIGGGIG